MLHNQYFQILQNFLKSIKNLHQKKEKLLRNCVHHWIILVSSLLKTFLIYCAKRQSDTQKEKIQISRSTLWNLKLFLVLLWSWVWYESHSSKIIGQMIILLAKSKYIRYFHWIWFCLVDKFLIKVLKMTGFRSKTLSCDSFKYSFDRQGLTKLQ